MREADFADNTTWKQGFLQQQQQVACLQSLQQQSLFCSLQECKVQLCLMNLFIRVFACVTLLTEKTYFLTGCLHVQNQRQDHQIHCGLCVSPPVGGNWPENPLLCF